jgi:hypothetical protein
MSATERIGSRYLHRIISVSIRTWRRRAARDTPSATPCAHAFSFIASFAFPGSVGCLAPVLRIDSAAEFESGSAFRPMSVHPQPAAKTSRVPMWLSVISVGLNLALIAVLLARRADVGAGAAVAAASTDRTETAAARRPNAAKSTRAWDGVATDDLRVLTTRLRDLGLPAGTIREIIRARINARFAARLNALTAPDPNTPFWRTPRNGFALGSEEMAEYTRLQHERSALLRDLLKNPFFGEAAVSIEQRRRFGDMPTGKIEQVQRIEDDYAEMNAAIAAGMHGILLPEDREKLALLEREKRADLAALLNPTELTDYQMRASPLTAELSKTLGGFAATDAEFRAIYAANQAMAERISVPGTVPTTPQMIAASRELAEQLKTSLGEARYGDYLRETNPEFQQLSRVAESANIPAENVLRAYNLHDTVTRESNRIDQDTTLTPEQKRAALQAVASNVRTEMNALFGPASADAARATSWLNLLERGYGVSFDPGGFGGAVSTGPGMYRIRPGGSVNIRAIAPLPGPNFNRPPP